jgi:hypothetical protein
MRFQQFLGKNSREKTSLSSAGVLNAFSQDGKYFSICCSTAEFLLEFLKAIVTANLFLVLSPTVKPPKTLHMM